MRNVRFIGAFSGPDYSQFQFDISEFISSEFTFRLRSSNNMNTNEFARFDNFVIAVSNPTLDYATSFTEGDPPIAIGATSGVGIDIFDLDSTHLNRARIALTNPSAGDVLSIAGTLPTGITASFNGPGNILTLSGDASKADYELALQQVRFHNTSQDPLEGVRTIEVTVRDTTNLVSNPAVASINVIAVNDAPEKYDIEPTPLDYTEKDGPVAITSTITVNDVDNTHLTSASIQITGNYASGQDVLAFTTQNGIIGSWDAITGTLTLSGSATLADYQAALRSITYENSSLDPSTATRTVTFRVNDGELDSDPLTREITITAVNDAPVITVDGGDSDNASLVETNAGLFVQGTLSVNDPDSADIVGGDVSDLVVSGTSTGMISSHAELLAMLTVTETVIAAGDTSGALTWSFDSGSEAFDYLAVGETLTLTYTVQVNDSQGATDTQEVTITVTGTNDAPLISVEAGDSAGETLSITGTTLTSGGTLSVADLDRTDTVTAAITGFSRLGDDTGLTLSNAQLQALLSLNAGVIDGTTQAGTINWAFDSAGYTFGYLGSGQSLTLTYTITVTDSQNATDTQDITIVINGDNSAPVISVGADNSDADTLAETDSTLATTGTLSVTDINTTDEVTSAVTQVIAAGTTTGLQSDNAALLAMLTVNANVIDGTTETGTINWSFDSASEAFDYLAFGETLTLTYTVQVIDSQNATDTQEVTITVTGTNDAPVISVQLGDSVGDSLGVTGATLTTDGTLSVADLDRSDEVTAAITTLSKSGDLTGLTLSDAQLEAMLSLNANVIDGTQQAGTINWGFDSAGYTFGYLGADESITLVYTITVTDSQNATDTQDITIVINGDNSAPVISVGADNSDAETLAETDSTLVTTGTLSVTDINTTDEVTSTITQVVAAGTTTGLQSNYAGLLAMLSLNANVIDGTTETGTITWSFDSGSEAFDYLAFGESLTLTYTVQVTDSQGATDTQEVTITVTGTNDAPVISVELGDSVGDSLGVTGATLTTDGTLSVADLDRSDVVTAAITTLSKSGDLTGLTLSDAQLESMLSLNANVIDGMNQSGTINWSFNSDTYTFGYLGATESITLVYTITVTDSQNATDTQDITIVINGDNSAPVISVGAGNSDAETLAEADTTLATTGTLSVTDINTTDEVTSTVTQVITAGTTTGLQSDNATLLAMLSVNTNVIDGTTETGTITWSFDSASEAFDYLAFGETLTLTYTVQVTDSQNATDTQEVTITVTGTNDAPVITIIGSDSIGDSLGVTGATLTTDGTLSVSDLDRSDEVTAAITTFSKSGDLTGLTLSDAQLEAMLLLNANVIDGINQSGTINWSFNSDTYTFGYLGATESITLVYTITVTDSQNATDTQDITIVINGDNSVPVISVGADNSDAETLVETDTTLATTGTLSVTDINTTDEVTSTVTQVIAAGTTTGLQSDNAGLLAMLTVNANVIDGTSETGTITWSFDSGSEAFDYLAVNESLTLTYTVQVIDSQNATDTQEVTITVTGTNDAPVITVAAGDSVGDSLGVTGTTLTTAGTLSVADLDRSDEVTAAITTFSKTGELAGLTLSDAQLEAMLSLNANVIDGTTQAGTITWDFNSDTYTFGYLGATESITLVYTITVTDSQDATDSQDITVVINGTNTAPDITVGHGDSDSDILAETDTTLTTTGTLSVLDINTTDTVTATVNTVSASGTTTGLQSNNAALLTMLTVNPTVIEDTTATGTITWKFDSAGEAFDYLAVGESLTLSYTIIVVDSAGATDSAEVSVTITGTNDAPVAVAGSASGNEDDTSITGQLIASDVDATDTMTFSLVSGPSSGSVTVAGNGEFTFSPGNDFQDLAIGESRMVTFVYQVADNHGATDQQTVTVTIDGRNDAPIISIGAQDHDTAHLIESGSTLTTTGTMTVFDIDRSDIVTATVTGVIIGGDVAGLSSTAAEILAMFSVTQTVVDSTNQSGSLHWFFDSQTEYFDYLLTDQTIQLSYEITVEDSHGLTAIRYAHIHITTNNQAPVATGETYSILPNSQLKLSAPGPLANDFDPDGDEIQFVLASGPTNGTLTFSPDGALVYTPGSQYAAVDTIRYQVTDGRLYSEIVELRIETLAAPVADNQSSSTSTGASGPVSETTPQDDYDPAELVIIEELAAVNEAVSSISTQALEGPLDESTFDVMEYVKRPDLRQRMAADERELQSLQWLFEQNFRNIRDRNLSWSERIRMISDELIVSTIPGDNELTSNLNDLKLGDAIMTTANFTIGAATAGTVFWALRGAALIATFAASIPALRNLDPANLLAEYRGKNKNDDELESMIDSTAEGKG